MKPWQFNILTLNTQQFSNQAKTRETRARPDMAQVGPKVLLLLTADKLSKETPKREAQY